MFAALLGIIGCIAGYVTNPARLFQSYIVAFAYTSLIGLGAFFFVMVQFLTGSAWSVTMRRIMENIMITLPVGLMLFIPIAIGLHEIYPVDEPAGGRPPAPCCGPRAAYLTPNFFIAPHGDLFLPVVAVGRLDLSSVDQAGHRALGEADEYRFALERAGPVPGGRGGNVGVL